MEILGKITAFLISIFISPIIYGFVFIKLWSWFIVSTFNVEPLRLIEAMGILLIISFIRAKKNNEDSNKTFNELIIESIGFNIGLAIITLGLGWIFSLFM